MADKIKVTFQTIDVNKDGEPIGQGELYWNFLVDNHVVDSRTTANPVKVLDGSTINLTKAYTVTKDAG